MNGARFHDGMVANRPYKSQTFRTRSAPGRSFYDRVCVRFDDGEYWSGGSASWVKRFEELQRAYEATLPAAPTNNGPAITAEGSV